MKWLAKLYLSIICLIIAIIAALLAWKSASASGVCMSSVVIGQEPISICYVYVPQVQR
jgi:hypothetical protein